jgi:hypothetical protein
MRKTGDAWQLGSGSQPADNRRVAMARSTVANSHWMVIPRSRSEKRAPTCAPATVPTDRAAARRRPDP